MELRLGPLLPEHRSRVREILDTTGAFRADEIDVALELFDASLGDPPDPDYELVGLFNTDAARHPPPASLLGYACFGPTPTTDRTYDLYWIAVDPDAQRIGAGSRLLGEVERRLHDRRGRLLVVETSSRHDYHSTRRFYETRGYVAAACVRDFYAPGDDRVIYTKRFTHQHLSGARP